MKLVNLHGPKTHLAIPTKHGPTGWAPRCRPRVWLDSNRWGSIQVVEDFEGEESQINCKLCLARMRKGKK